MKNLDKKTFLLLTILIWSCQGKMKCRNEKNCDKHYKNAISKLNNYYEYKNSMDLDTALISLEKSYKLCPERRKNRFPNVKITLLLLMKEYEWGYRFIDSIELDLFKSSYKKNVYSKTFQGLLYEKQGDTINRNICFKNLVNEIKLYLSNNPSDNDAISDLYYTKLRYENKKVVISEIDSTLVTYKGNKDFLERLKNTINMSEELK